MMERTGGESSITPLGDRTNIILQENLENFAYKRLVGLADVNAPINLQEEDDLDPDERRRQRQRERYAAMSRDKKDEHNRKDRERRRFNKGMVLENTPIVPHDEDAVLPSAHDNVVDIPDNCVLGDDKVTCGKNEALRAHMEGNENPDASTPYDLDPNERRRQRQRERYASLPKEKNDEFNRKQCERRRRNKGMAPENEPIDPDDKGEDTDGVLPSDHDDIVDIPDNYVLGDGDEAFNYCHGPLYDHTRSCPEYCITPVAARDGDHPIINDLKGTATGLTNDGGANVDFLLSGEKKTDIMSFAVLLLHGKILDNCKYYEIMPSFQELWGFVYPSMRRCSRSLGLRLSFKV